METWEKLLVGALAVGLIFLFRPGLKRAFQQSREAENKDWQGVIVPVLLVVAFVMLLIVLVRG